ncbi:hypothetical protein OHO83_17515 [Streptomyces sp. NBC_00569]|uniref:hypothetical protein n=1 Tax=unclassified Streptomyces TaxID=2593676 RepID=UPI00224F340B|nr:MULTISPECIES: hypothetical protein [unclassified Streptomyces]MCX5439593.1 hypothetical protein [Streptomyces sp. NBC_00063]WUB93961.1 hypothetical protein OHO83_17515 [Streptomyces sp. NBC_00569]
MTAIACSNPPELTVRLNAGVSACNDAGMSMPGMPLHAEAIPDCTEMEAHRAAYKRAKANDAIFVCIARRGRHWSVELDVMASSKPYVPDQAMTILNSAAEALVLDGTVEQANIGADYISMWPIKTEDRAREIGAAFHAAMYGLQQLHMAVPSRSARS